ncbi:MAG TPA: type 2 lanthipeptide synthetase LanM family protein [Ktedonobacteraceae bacterium]|nr:type 2 lanthipeptide synthetase LanM family protein [Ktedonobacteraceae bacterium]
MEETIEEREQGSGIRGASSRWYHAITLTERIASLRMPMQQPAGSTGNLESAHRNLQRWQEQTPFNTGEFFAKRLAMDAITESDLLALLAEPIEDVHARMSLPTPPDWLVELIQAFDGADASTDLLLPVQLPGEDARTYAFLEPLQPLLKRGVRPLLTGIEDLERKYEVLPFDPNTLLALLFANLAKHVLPKVNRTLVLELNVARLQGRLQGELSQERFHSYVQLLDQPDELWALLEEYCVQARQLIVTVDLWSAFSLEFLQQLCADWKNIRALFTPEQDPGKLVEVTGGAGDTHRGGRSVMLLKFSSGFRLVYKPKSLKIDVHFQELLDWLNQRGHHPGFRTIRCMDRGTYGWTEYVVAAACQSEEEIGRFYERQGGYLALLYALEAIDFHAENIIAAGEHPILIDLEALFHPRIQKDGPDQEEHPVYHATNHSVLRIGLLPQRTWSSEDAIGIDISGLGAQAGQLSPQPQPKWEGTGTDEMRLVREQVRTRSRHNRPSLNGHDVQTADYCDRIAAGFTNIYQLLIEYREALLNEFLPRFTHNEIRFVARATRFYGVLLTESFHPNMLRNSLKRERLFDRLWLPVIHAPHLSRLIPAERSDLLKGDIPMFTTFTVSRDLFTSHGESIPAFFKEPSLELVRKRIRQLDKDDLTRQIWLIRASFASMSTHTHPITKQPLPLTQGQTDVSRKRLLAAARAVGDRLCNRALYGEGTAAGWLGINLVKEREWSLMPTFVNMYNGTPGIVLFLSYLGSVTGEASYTTLARSALKTVHYEIEQSTKNLKWATIGAFDGLGSVIYLFSHLGALWQEPALWHEAEELVALLPALIAKDEALDIMAGSAGCLASLLSLYAVVPSARTLSIARQCGERLLTSALAMQIGVGWQTVRHEKPLPGFSHGAAGIALSLLRLAAVSGEEQLRLTALAALEYERSLFSEDKQHWQHACKQADAEIEPGMRNKGEYSWCHGAAGIGLARLGSLRYVDDTTIREEIDVALRATIANGFGGSHALCHGDFGNLETLLVASQTLEDPWLREKLEQLTSLLLASISQHGWVTGAPFGVETPGLMTGLAGIGYELLRLASPTQVPSVLSLAPPCPAF